MVIVPLALKRRLHLALYVLFVEILASAKLAMALAGKVVWEITMTTMEPVSIKFLVEIAAMDVPKEMVFAITANKGQPKGYF